MTDLAKGPERIGARRILARWNLALLGLSLPVLRYGFAVICVSIALGLALALQHFKFEQSPLFNLSIALTTWYAGVGPSVLAVVLATACFSYFFSGPNYALYFVTWAVVVASFVGVLRRREHEIRRLNQELSKRAAELEASNKELEAFAYSASHDLRAPLRHVISYAELLQKQASSLLDDRSQRHMKRILEAAKRMANLIDDLLAFSRIGRAETRKTRVHLEQLTRDVVAEFEEETRGRNIGWKIGALPVCYGDRSMLKIVLTNLISNAVKFTRTRTQAEIEIGYADGKNQKEVFVRDNGAGFDMQYANKLFGVFQRLHRSAEFEGTGIGLATVQRIIERHGGQVRGEGVLDRGATFYFSLPEV
jgi:signal transduction histidine kinase